MGGLLKSLVEGKNYFICGPTCQAKNILRVPLLSGHTTIFTCIQSWKIAQTFSQCPPLKANNFDSPPLDLKNVQGPPPPISTLPFPVIIADSSLNRVWETAFTCQIKIYANVFPKSHHLINSWTSCVQILYFTSLKTMLCVKCPAPSFAKCSFFSLFLHPLTTISNFDPCVLK